MSVQGHHKWVKVQSNELGHKTDKEKDLQAEKMARENEGKETVEAKTWKLRTKGVPALRNEKQMRQ